jgi:hypothetical protein
MENNDKNTPMSQSCKNAVSKSVILPTDLRIGNLLFYNGFIVKVSEICSPKPLRDKRYSDKWILELFDGAGLITCTIDEVSPIDFTYEWLEKLGFKYDETPHNYHWKHSHWLRIQKFPGNGGIILIDGKQNRFLDFIHEVQNVFDILISSELTVC